MKLKSLILGSVAAAGLSTAGYAADLDVLTSLDVCDALGLSGLTISSDTNCLQITGGVSYEFNWGDYRGSETAVDTLAGTQDFDNNDSGPLGDKDWESQVEAWLQFVGTADSDFGPARAVIRLEAIDEVRVQNEEFMADDDDTDGVDLDEAYVSVGDSTVIMAGKKGSIANFGDDEPFNFLGLFNSSEVDTGVSHDIGIEEFYTEQFDTGSHVIQVVSDLGNGVNVGLGLENLAESDEVDMAGTLVGVVGYAGEGITAHVTGLMGGILDGDVDAYAVHAGATGTFDIFRIRGAIAANHYVPTDESFYNALASAAATFDMFTLAVSGEVNGGSGLDTDYGVGASIGAAVTEGVAINLGGRYYDNNNGGTSGYQVAAQLVAAVTETISLTGEVGVYGTTERPDDTTDFYGAAQLAWAPGGGFTSALGGEVHENGAYKVTFEAAKEFN
ncbi:porin [Devosia pacifica]|uniref:Porin n=1 Tax=Devosia pacifica TaxID=1335967 RepID=A0A918VY92_9HYPH|nr:hypothetical protein [Devosia pacifica]GHA36251.1 porin [Devosia pacifica]